MSVGGEARSATCGDEGALRRQAPPPPASGTERADTAVGQQIIDLIGVPKDAWEIAAQLEVLGLRDADARGDYGARDLFDLARRIYARFQDGGYRYYVEGEDPQPRQSELLRYLRDYAAGLSFALPMVLQAVAMVVWGYGIWGATELDLRTGTAIALGFIASTIVAGGFSQALVRRGLFYLYQQEEGLARWTVLRAWTLSVRVVLLLLVPAFALNALFAMLPWTVVLTAAAYYVALSILWLNWSLIYVAGRPLSFLGVTAVALVVVVLAARVAGWGAVAANAAGLVTACALSFAVALRRLNARASRQKERPPVNPPRLTVLVYSTSRFFLYGFLYSAFLFADRIVAWTTKVGREDFPPYPFWLSVRYELGMDLALVVVVLLSGVVEVATRRFSEALVPAEKRTKSGNVGEFIDSMRARVRRHRGILALAAVGAAMVAAATMFVLRGMTGLRMHETLASPAALRVFAVAVVSYVLLMFGLQNALILLTLSRVDLATRAVGLALTADLAVGFVLSRAMHYSAAVFGLLAGTAVLALVTGRSVRRVLDRLDHVYYAAW